MNMQTNIQIGRGPLRSAATRISVAAALLLSTTTLADATVFRTATDTDLKILDPVSTTTAVTIMHGLKVYDTLFSMDENETPQPQMVDTYSVSDDGLIYRFRLRDGLVFSDGSPVESSDVIASIKRWAQKRSEGQLMNERLETIVETDSTAFEIRLKKPFALLIRGLANPVLPMFVMREEEAKTDPSAQITTVIGSGPFIFRQDLWRPGDVVVYEKSPTYKPRSEKASGQAGGKVVNVDRLEERYMPDGNTALQALRNDELDFLYSPPQDAVESLRQDPNFTVGVIDNQGMMGAIRLNTMHPPFNNVYARQAMQALVDQPSILSTMVGSKDMYRVCYSIFGCGAVPFETAAGTEDWKGQNLEKAKDLLKKSGYDGRPIVVMIPSDDEQLMNQSLVLVEFMRQAGFAVDPQSMDWSTLTSRRENTGDPAKDPKVAWDIFGTWLPGSFFKDPFNLALVATGDPKTAWYGWPKDDKIEALRAAWIDAPTTEDQRKAIDDIQVQYYASVPQIYTGQFYQASAWRSQIKGVLKGSYPVYWNLTINP
ncbi:ABC transporter substrate-binding protein [Ensifer sp. YR511]|uniref:ABC transporter substrate-binding protein n=1 Tax=Ensifer sp. YR511 TaxID=1855294 RepID=UPI00088B2D90|nr:ABC transporter substrate-binding protein [Ensifer sp. YR511]SDN39435.1 peptide/nickel transport system substrate-binding protein [Ensifer sp. YR511]